MEERIIDKSLVEECLLGVVASLFTLVFTLVLCFGKKRQSRSGSTENVEIGEIEVQKKPTLVIPQVEEELKLEINNPDSSEALPNEIASPKIGNEVENELIAQYDPATSQSQSTIDPYDTIDKEAIKKSDQIANVVNENSASGSGNSDSGNSIYTKVKKVEKKEEIAYAVVDIKDSQEKYEVVNGNIVRRETHPDIEKTLEGGDVQVSDLNRESEKEGVDRRSKTEEEPAEDSGPYSTVKNGDCGCVDAEKDNVDKDLGEASFRPSTPTELRSLPESPRSLPDSPRPLPESPRSLPASPRSLPESPRSLPGSPKVFNIQDTYAVVNKGEKGTVLETTVDIRKDVNEDPGSSDFYTEVKDASSRLPRQRKDDAYSIAVKADREVVPTGNQEDSGGSGLYAQVNTASVATQVHQEPPPPPPPHAPHLHPPHITSSNPETYIDDGSYEQVTNKDTSESYNMYDSINEVKNKNKTNKSVKSKTKTKIKEHSESKKFKNETKYKQKSHKKQDSLGDATSLDSKSPKQSRFSRVNPFKTSKKTKHKHSESLTTDSLRPEKEHEEAVDETKDKASSLPSSARKGSTDIHEDVTKRLSNPSRNVPPPLPSYDKLKHLTEHQKRRGSSFDAACSSADSSPKSSPRTPMDHLPMHYPAKLSPRSASIINESSSESKATFSDDFDDKYSTVNPSSVEPSFDENDDIEDEKYSRVSNTAKTSISSHDENEVIEEDDKYTTVKDAFDSEEKSSKKEEKPYDVVKDLDKTDNISKPTPPLEPTEGHGNEVDLTTSEIVDEPDYAEVDYQAKQIERERIASIKNNGNHAQQKEGWKVTFASTASLSEDGCQPIPTTEQPVPTVFVTTLQSVSTTTVTSDGTTTTTKQEIIETTTPSTAVIVNEKSLNNRDSNCSDYAWVD